MKIVIATPILYNATSPFNHLFKDIIGGFLDDGNQVIRLVAVEDKLETDFKYGFTGKNIEYKLYKRKNSEHRNIISRYIRDSLTNIKEAIGILKLKNVDVLFEDVSYSSYWAVKAAKIKGIKVVAMLQDVWPDNAVQSGIISEKSFFYRYFEMWQKAVYKNADQIICISDDMKEFIASKGVDANKIEVIYNWGYSDEVVDIPWKENEFVKKYNLDQDKFYAIYAGNIGRMQNVELIVEAAKLLKNNDTIRFLIIGDGVKREEIEKQVENSNLGNVQMLPMQPSSLATSIYSAAGVNIIPLVEGGIKTALPSKTGIVLSCGRPVIFAFGEECAFEKLVQFYNCGNCISAVNAFDLQKSILEIQSTKTKKCLGSYNFFKSLFRKNENVSKYCEKVK